MADFFVESIVFTVDTPSNGQVMLTISLLHLGDVHYPNHATTPAAELSDPNLSPAFIASLAPGRLKSAVDELTAVVGSRQDCLGILVSGDLTSYGNIDGYRKCLEYLDGALKGLPIWPTDRVRVVPGNHDLDRHADTSTDPLARFREIEQAWATLGFPARLAVGGLNALTLTRDSAVVRIQSANSCLGCGEIRLFPLELHAVIAAEIAKLNAIGADIPKVFELVGEQLDTPAFSSDDLTAMVQDIRAMEAGALNVMLSHHAILPQARPRISVYAELMNGGRARTQLSELGHSVIYCHGHIHESPIEVVTQPDQGGKLISIAAPQLIDGFNLLVLHFAPNRAVFAANGTARAVPIGCEVIRYKAQAHGGLRPDAPVRVPLAGPHEIALIRDDLLSAVLRTIGPSPVRFSDVLSAVRANLGGVVDRDIQERLLELEWIGLIEVHNRTSQAAYWQIQRVGLQ